MKTTKEQAPARVQSYLRGADYPAAKEDLIALAEKNGAPRPIIDVLEALTGERFDGPDQVMKAYGQLP